MTPLRIVAVTVDDYLDTCPREFRECREYSHSLRPRHEDYELVGGSVPYRVTLDCRDCGMVRIDGFDSALELATRQYIAPDGYYVVGVVVSRIDIRRWKAKRVRQRITYKKGRRKAA